MAVVARVLDSPEIASLVEEIDALRWTGRPGYPTRSLVGACVVRAVYAISSWSKTAALIGEHDGLAEALGARPSVFACYRFAEKLRRNPGPLERCIDDVIAALRREHPGFGTNLAVDASDMPAWANGQRYVSKGGRERERYSDPDASWGHRSAVSTRKGGGFYGYKIHTAVCTETELPVAWRVETGKRNESLYAAGLVDEAKRRGVPAATCALDRAYDLAPVYDGLEQRGCRPVIPLRRTADVKHGLQLRIWTGPPTRLHPTIRRDTARWKRLYKARGAVERTFGRLKHEWGLLPLRNRGRERVQLHADLVVLTRLACALQARREARRE